MKRYFLMILPLLLMVVLSGCEQNILPGEVSLFVLEQEVVLEVGESKQITASVEPQNTRITWKSNNSEVATVSRKGIINGVGVGTTIIDVSAGDITHQVTVTVVEKVINPTNIEIVKEISEMVVGDTFQFEAVLYPLEAVQSFQWTSLNPEIVTIDSNGVVTSKSVGEALITVASTVKPSIFELIKIVVSKGISEEEILHGKIMNIIDSMTIEEKIGQMFMVGFEGTTVPSSLKQSIKNKHFGNFIYFGANVSNPKLVGAMSKEIQNQVMAENGIPAFISMDQEGGMVVRFESEATHFIGNMGLVATNNSANAYNIGKYNGEELIHYGINNNLAPSLDINNNPLNSVIGIRSYSDDPRVVSEYGLKMIQGLKDSNVLSTVKHFPGHGDTEVDSHYGLPIINHNKERLYEVELAPFINAINGGVDSIMSAHIIFSAFDSELPATLSYKVLTELLREELGFKGIIMTDSMRMNAITSNFGDIEAAILAIQAGVDILLYTESTSTSIKAYDGVLKAVGENKITEKRINESVYRILEKKFKYGLMDEEKPNNTLSESDFKTHSDYNKSLIEQSITLAKGNIDWFKKEKSTLIISTKCPRYPLVPGYSITSAYNSLAFVGKTILESRGATNVDYYVIESTINTADINKILTMSRNFEQVIIAVENVSASQASLINQIGKEKNNMLVVALRNPYDYLSYTNVNHFVCTYGYYTETVEAVMSLLLKDFEAKGVLPVKVNGLN